MPLLLSCVKKQKPIVSVPNFCEIYEEPETNKISVPAQDYWFYLETAIAEKKKKGKQLDSQEELFYALLLNTLKYESKHKELCPKD